MPKEKTSYEPRLLDNPKKPETSLYTVALLDGDMVCDTVEEALIEALDYINSEGGDDDRLVIAEIKVSYLTPTKKQIEAAGKKILERSGESGGTFEMGRAGDVFGGK